MIQTKSGLLRARGRPLRKAKRARAVSALRWLLYEVVSDMGIPPLNINIITVSAAGTYAKRPLST